MSSIQLNDTSLLEFSRRLQFATDYDALLDELCREVRESTGYQTAWVSVYLSEKNAFKILALDATGAPVDWDTAQEIPLDIDPYLTEMVEANRVSVIEDAQVDPRVNREIVTRLGNRTVINLPMWFGEVAYGAVGTGSFGEEGVKVPTSEQLGYLEKLAMTVGAASVRILKSERLRSERSAAAAAVLDQLDSVIERIRDDAAGLNGESAPTAEQIVAATRRASELIERGREAISGP